MADGLRRAARRALAFPLPDRVGRWLTKRACRPLLSHLEDEITEGFLLLLLRGMDLAFWLSRRYRRNLRGFTGRYVFQTEDGSVAVSALFANGAMSVKDQAVAEWEAKVTFRNEAALWATLTGGKDVFEAILADEVTVDGNLNYVYKFGFLAADLQQMLGGGH
jgi:hypothetical protein